MASATVVGRRRRRFRNRFCSQPGQSGSWHQLLCGTLPSAASTAAGVIGRLTQANADRVVDGIGDRRRGGDIGGLGDAVGIGRALALIVFQNDDVDLPASRAGRRACIVRDWD